MAAPKAIVPRSRGVVAANGQTVTLDALMRMSATDILVTYGKDVYDIVAYLQASGLVARDGRSNEDLALQAEARAKIALEGDCGVSDFYKAELEGKS